MTTTVWTTATSKNENDGCVIIFRYVSDFDKDFDRLDNPVRVIITWKYDSETGMPAADVREWMDAMEDALTVAVEEDEFASLVLVSTGENVREWTYYARSGDEFMLRLNQALGDRPRVPVNIHIGEDSQWTTFDEFRRRVRE
ncbi:DUF695 domain-containing protein [Paraburkholderia graminis]|uniref:DUF695 domain-containing protein n=1 Tax=Paraburkholderia graminis TaxID=60548 RepID=UPI0038BC26EE